MEKLLRDLNIYAHSFMNCNLTFIHDGNRIRVQGDEIGPYVAESIILNKKFGWIGWLVENDKIDREKFGNSETKSSKYSDFELSYDTPREDYTNTLLMELALQDEPIQFLIEMLK